MPLTAVFAGSFCPFTKGHQDIVDKVLPLFDHIVIAIGHNIDKHDQFSEAQRREWIQQIYQGNPKISVLSYTGLTIELCQRLGASYLIRGVRNAQDFGTEEALAEINKRLAPEIETVLFLASSQWRMVSSTMVRELWHYGADYRPYVSYEIPKE